jgi:peroxidase
LLSLLLVRDLDVPSDTDTTFVMQYGQFVDRKCIRLELTSISHATNNCDLSFANCFVLFVFSDDMLETMESKSGIISKTMIVQ